MMKCLKRISLLVLTLVIGALPALAAGRNDFIGNRLYADQKRLHLGFSVGMHFQNLSFTHNGYTTPEGENWYAEIPAYSPGFCVNVLADLRLHKYFNLRLSPGMYFGNKTAHFQESHTGELMKQDVKSAYVVVPLDLKISGDRYKNSRPYVTFGVMASYDVSKKRSDFLQFKPFNTYITLGLGCDFYLPFFKLNPEIKFCFGLQDVLQHKRPDLVDDPMTMKITDSLKKVKSNMIVLTFYFE